ncbi:Fe2+-dependent dioxygenase [Roseomonas sp. BN140053]|uniref:Fe2+-dependent dioxygenase n=1 Tax=Roseomonas sp. BN140053 TaxID=3391898 RepID=UPI0039EAB36F
MILCIAEVLEPLALESVRDKLLALPFRDGRDTAGRDAARVKRNLQADPSDDRAAALKNFLAERIAAHPLFRLAARPARHSPLLLSRYEAGMAYGTHVDDAIMGGMRSDVSFTLFLCEPDTYAGGALVIESAAGEQEFRLPAGAMVVYPSDTLHRVEQVTEGTRLAAVGWCQSLIRDPARRELLFDLDTARALPDGEPQRDRLLARCSANLLRQWGEPG